VWLGILIVSNQVAVAAGVPTLVKNINEMETVSVAEVRVHDIAVMNGVAYFTYKYEVRGSELWRSDGTVAGTVLVREGTLPQVE